MVSLPNWNTIEQDQQQSEEEALNKMYANALGVPLETAIEVKAALTKAARLHGGWATIKNGLEALQSREMSDQLKEALVEGLLTIATQCQKEALTFRDWFVDDLADLIKAAKLGVLDELKGKAVQEVSKLAKDEAHRKKMFAEFEEAIKRAEREANE